MNLGRIVTGRNNSAIVVAVFVVSSVVAVDYSYCYRVSATAVVAATAASVMAARVVGVVGRHRWYGPILAASGEMLRCHCTFGSSL